MSTIMRFNTDTSSGSEAGSIGMAGVYLLTVRLAMLVPRALYS